MKNMMIFDALRESFWRLEVTKNIKIKNIYIYFEVFFKNFSNGPGKKLQIFIFNFNQFQFGIFTFNKYKWSAPQSLQTVKILRERLRIAEVT